MRYPTTWKIGRRFAAVFERMQWKWRVNRVGEVRGLKVGDYYVPNADQIRRHINRNVESLNQSLLEKGPAYFTATESGRIRIERRYNELKEAAGYDITLVADHWEL
mgnify:CR=1 FL=1